MNCHLQFLHNGHRHDEAEIVRVPLCIVGHTLASALAVTRCTSGQFVQPLIDTRNCKHDSLSPNSTVSSRQKRGREKLTFGSIEDLIGIADVRQVAGVVGDMIAALVDGRTAHVGEGGARPAGELGGGDMQQRGEQQHAASVEGSRTTVTKAWEIEAAAYRPWEAGRA